MIPAALLGCILLVHPKTMDAIVKVESAGYPYYLNVNHLSGRQPHPHSAAETVATAKTYIALGYNVDIGLAQVNNRNLESLHLSIEQVVDPCTNLRAGATILTAFYSKAARIYGEGQPALWAALRAYNTGSFTKGDSYVARFVPGLQSAPAIAGRRPDAGPNYFSADTEVAWDLE